MRRSVTLESKQEAIRKLDSGCTIASVARHFQVDPKSVREWRANRTEIMNSTDTSRRRLRGGGRKLKCEELDSILFEKVMSMRFQGARVSRSCIRNWGIALADEFEVTNLNFSPGWVDKFMERHNLSLRRSTSKWTHTPVEMASRAASFIIRCKRALDGIPLDRILAFDETALFLGNPSEITVDVRGSTRVQLSTGSIDKFRITGIFGSYADGTKLTPYLLWKSTSDTPTIAEVEGIPVIKCKNAWISDKVMKTVLNHMFPFPRRNRLYLIIDSARPHYSTSTLRILTQKNIELILIPGGITHFVQPADVYIFRRLKSKLNEYIELWLQMPDIPRTPSGTIKTPSSAQCAIWVKTAWRTLDCEYLSHSFTSTLFADPLELHVARDNIVGGLFIEKFTQLQDIHDTVTSNNNGADSDDGDIDSE